MRHIAVAFVFGALLVTTGCPKSEPGGAGREAGGRSGSDSDETRSGTSGSDRGETGGRESAGTSGTKGFGAGNPAAGSGGTSGQGEAQAAGHSGEKSVGGSGGVGGTGGAGQGALTPLPIGEGCWIAPSDQDPQQSECDADYYTCPAMASRVVYCSNGHRYSWGCAVVASSCNCDCFTDGASVRSCSQAGTLNRCFSESAGAPAPPPVTCSNTLTATACEFPAAATGAGPKQCCFDAECPPLLPHCHSGRCDKTAPSQPYTCECRKNEDCSSGHCSSNKCIETCITHADCGDNIECLKDGLCSSNARPCSGNKDCAAGYSCYYKDALCGDMSECACALTK